MQPTYLPWAGYFNLIAKADRFVFLDDVQFERRSWQSRNRILLDGEEHYLTVPVRKAERGELVKHILIDNEQDWRPRHLRSLSHAYGKSPSGREVVGTIESVFLRNHSYLAELNQDLIESIMNILGIETEVFRASALRTGGKRSEHLAEICRAIECSDYLSPAGSREYLAHDRFAEATHIGLAFQQYVPSPYVQLGADRFIGYLSIVDVLAHCGREFARTYILDGSHNC